MLEQHLQSCNLLRVNLRTLDALYGDSVACHPVNPELNLPKCACTQSFPNLIVRETGHGA